MAELQDNNEFESGNGGSGHAVSRRAFLGLLGAGAAALVIDRASGGALIATAEELAAFATGNSTNVQFITIDLNQVAITVRDAKDSRKFVEGAVVRVQSLADKAVDGHGNHRMVEARTNELGVAIIDVRQLAEDPASGKYDFYGRVFVAKPGWRDFEIGAMRFTAGEATGVYFQEDDGKPYLRCLTFDDYDIQYTTQTMVTTSETKADHDLVATVVTPKNDQESEIAYWTGDPRTTKYHKEDKANRIAHSVAVDRLDGSFYKDANGEFAATHTCTHPFLDPNTSNVHFFAPEMPLHLHVWVDRRDRFRVDPKLAVIEGAIDEPGHGSGDERDDTWELRVHNDDDHYDGLNLDLPEGVPGLPKINMWVPSFPGNILFTPQGKFSIHYGKSWGFIKEKGGQTEDEQREEAEAAGENPPESSAWEKMPKEDIGKQMENKFNELSKQYDLFTEAANRAKVPGSDFITRGGAQAQSSAAFTISIGAFIEGEQHVDNPEPYKWLGKGGIFGKVAFSYNWSQLFFVGGTIPVNLILDIYTSIMVKMQLEWGVGTIERINTGAITGGKIIIPFKFYIALTVSVGMNGVASLGVRGSAYLYVTLVFESGAEEVDSKIEIGAEITIVVELLIFHYEWTVASFSYPPESRAARLFSEGNVQGAVAASSLPDLDALFQPFSEEGLLASSEFEMKPTTDPYVAALSADGDALSAASEVEYELVYSPYLDGHGIQDTEEPQLMAMNEGSTFAPEVEWRFLHGAFSNARMQILYVYEGVGNPVLTPGGIFRLSSMRVLDFMTGEYHTRTRVGVSVINDMSSGKISLNTTKILTDRYGYPEVDRWDLDFMAFSLTRITEHSYWALATVSTDSNPTSMSDSMMKSKLRIAFAGRRWFNWTSEYIFDNAELCRGEKYAHPYNMSFTELPTGDVGFACAVTAFNSPTDTQAAAQYLFTISFSYQNGIWKPNRPASLVEVKKPTSTSPTSWGMMAIDSVLAYPPQTSALHYDQSCKDGHLFNIAYTVQYTETGGTEDAEKRHLYFTVHKDNETPVSIDLFDNKKYSFTGNLTRFDHEEGGLQAHQLIARFTGEMEGVDPDESPLNKTVCFTTIDYNGKATAGASAPSYLISVDDIGPQNKNVDYGGFQLSADGNLLFFIKTFDGQVPESRYESDQVVQTDSAEESHQIWAARYIGGRFTDPFPLVDLTYSPDSFQHIPYSARLGGEDGGYVFFYGHITDVSAGTADTYSVRMPYTKRLTLVDIAPVEPAIPMGEPLKLEVTARNDGNVILSGFKVKFTDPTVGFEQTVECTCTYENYIPNVFDGQNLTTDDVEPDATAKSDIFFPGYTNTYAMTVDLPADYPAGAHDLQAVILEDSYVAPLAETHGEWGEDEQIVAAALSYADPEPFRFSMANGNEVDLNADAPAKGEESVHAADYVEG